MRIDGEWCLCDDGFVRPIIRGEVLKSDGYWETVPFLVDTGADCTVFSAAILKALRVQPNTAHTQLGGIGGLTASVQVATQIRLTCDDGGTALFRGQYAAFTQLESLDMSVLGRDILELFAVIVDRPQNIVALISQRHRYVIAVT